MAQEMTTLKERILTILNEDLAPWVFDGSEPMAERILSACGDGQHDRCSIHPMSDHQLVCMVCFTDEEPSGSEDIMSKQGMRGTTRADSIAERLWYVVVEAVAAGISPEDFQSELSQCWIQAHREAASRAVDVFAKGVGK